MKNFLAQARLLCAISAYLVACGGDTALEPTSTTQQQLEHPTALVPMPARDGKMVWDGGVIDLMVADAWAGCSYGGAEGTTPIAAWAPGSDSYLVKVGAWMSSALCTREGTTPLWMGFDEWISGRARTDCNFDSAGRPAMINVEKTPIKETILSVPPGWPSYHDPTGQYAFAYARDRLRGAGINLCIARRLRSAAPGTAGAEALLLSSAEQRHLAEVTRERAQVAALQYAQLAVAFSTPFDSTPPTIHNLQEAYVPILQHFGQAEATPDELEDIGTKFADSVQLVIETTRESLDLMARSGAARLPRGGHARSEAEEIWGTGSWRQRAMALLYGGDPLTVETDNSSPWQHFKNQPREYPGVGGVTSGFRHRQIAGTVGWPRQRDMPFAETDVNAPEVSLLFDLMRRYDIATLQDPNAGANRFSFALKYTLNPAIPGDNSNVAESDVYEANSESVDASANRLYRAVEAAIRTADCVVVSSGACQPVTVDDVSLSGGYSDFLLWQTHRITPSHATTLARRLTDILPGIAYYTLSTSTPEPYLRPGLFSIDGEVKLLQPPDTESAWAQFDPTAVFALRGPESIQGLFTRYAPFRLIDTVHPHALAMDQGFDMAYWTHQATGMAEAKRLLGAVGALEAVRESLLFAQRNLSEGSGDMQAKLAPFFSRRTRILDTISGAIGDTGISIRPNVDYVQFSGDYDSDPTTTEVMRYLYQKRAMHGAELGPSFRVRVTVPTDDPWWSGSCALFAMPAPWEPNLADSKQSKYFGRRLDDMDFTNITTSSLGETTTGLTRDLRVFVFDIALPDYATVVGNETRSWSFVAQKSTPSGIEYKLLVTNVELQRYRDPTAPVSGAPEIVRELPHEGQYFAYGGELNLMASKLMSVSFRNPSQPLYDGFGYPLRWVPPSNPSLYAGDSADDAVTGYLTKARSAAVDATAAVKDAFTNLLAIEKDKLDVAAAQKRSAEVARLAREELCGTSGTSECNPDFDTATPWLDYPSWISVERRNICADRQLLSSDENVKRRQEIQCTTLSYLADMMSPVDLAKAVLDARDQATVPAFDQYQGGALQTVLIEQWSALRKLVNAAEELHSAEDAVFARLDAAQATIDAAGAIYQHNCVDQAVKALIHSLRETRSTTYCGGDDDCLNTTHSFNEAPIVANDLKCFELDKSKPIPQQQLLQAYREGVFQLAATGSKVLTASATLRSASAKGFEVREKSRLAVAREKLEAELADLKQPTKTALYGRYHDYDLWRAKALLEGARRYAVAARRAIEARFVVNLSSIRDPEPFVAAPASWADEIYDYDLSLPASVGLSVGVDTGGVYPNRVLDYVSNLEGFVHGYAMKRPAAVAAKDAEVITLPGPQGYGGAATGGIDPAGYSWSFYCGGPVDGSWVGLPDNGRAMEACSGQRPTRARTFFALDPWGRLNNHISREPDLNQRFNARWRQHAINVVGTRIKDCRVLSPRYQAECYSQPFLRYSMSHTGPSWVTNYERKWRALPFPTGRIEAGKAIADEQWLDPVVNGFDKSFVVAVSRNELTERPFSGRYELIVEVGPEVDLSHIERIQILAGSTYWVQQQ